MLFAALKNITILAHIVAMLVFFNIEKLQPHVPVHDQKTVLLVTAHPDDESMFFGPTVGWALKNQHPLHLLCLSNGNATGIGETRQNELVNSAMLLGMSPYNLTIINSPALPDSMDIDWNTDDIIKYLSEVSEKVEPNLLVTFDEGGVSNHTNHRQVARAVREWGTSSGKEVWQLKTVSFWKKYTANLSILDLFLHGRSQITLFSNPEMHFRTWVSMFKGHKSQMKWFRYGWLFFSRYIFINDYDVYGRDLPDLPGILTPRLAEHPDL